MIENFRLGKWRGTGPTTELNKKSLLTASHVIFFGPLHLFHMVPFKSLPVWCTLPSHHMHGLKIEHTKSLLTMSQIWSREWEIEQLQKLRWRGRCVQMFIHNICKHVFFWRMKMASRFGINCKPKFDGGNRNHPMAHQYGTVRLILTPCHLCCKLCATYSVPALPMFT